jgi:hypothetical protein
MKHNRDLKTQQKKGENRYLAPPLSLLPVSNVPSCIEVNNKAFSDFCSNSSNEEKSLLVGFHLSKTYIQIKYQKKCRNPQVLFLGDKEELCSPNEEKNDKQL